jgi:hypothetical protein
MEALIHGANVLYLVSYLMRDILWLRIFTVVAAVCLIGYFYFRVDPLMTAIYWNLLFVALNGFWICRLVLERRPVQLTDEQEQLCRLVFHTISPREMLAMLKFAEWKNAEPGECFAPQGAPLDKLMVIYSGKARVEIDGRAVAEVLPGQFMGSIGFITGDPAPAAFVAAEPTRYLCWHKSKLKDFLAKNAELCTALHMTLGADLSHRLEASWAWRGAAPE